MQRQNEEKLISKIGSSIDLKIAAEWTRYSRQRQKPGETISHLFGRDIIDQILKQEDCAGIRIYYANSKPLTSFQKLILILINFSRSVVGTIGQDHLIITGTNSKGVDQIPGEKNQSKAVNQPETQFRNREFVSTSIENDYILGEQTMPCPESGCPSNKLSIG
ncbi:MAG: hypothetical protein EOP43_02620 [Sphingobacteriaceae bacterium]|nr:MAG: hypothetical protein EOP43_02620 [Sphingobacteriaceae bacterium]